MGVKDTPPPECVPSSPLQSPKWESNTLGCRTTTAYHGVPLRCKSEVSLQSTALERQQQCEAPAPEWHSAPNSPDQESRSSSSSSRSSSSSVARSDGTVSPIRQYMECIEPQSLSCAIVGDAGVGKSSLLLSYTTGKMPQDQPPTVYDKFSSKC